MVSGYTRKISLEDKQEIKKNMGDHKVMTLNASQGWQTIPDITVVNGRRMTILPLRRAGELINVRAYEEPDDAGKYPGTNTGIQMAPGQSVVVSQAPDPCDEWCWSSDYSGPKCCDADGDLTVVGDVDFRVPGAAAGALVGRIGQNGDWFLVGREPHAITADTNQEGNLYLGINDDQVNFGFSDNSSRLQFQILTPCAAGLNLASPDAPPDMLRARVNGGTDFNLIDGFYDEVFNGTGGTLELRTNGCFYDQIAVTVMVDAPAAPIHNGLWPFAHDAEPMRDGMIGLGMFNEVLSETDLVLFTPAGPLTFTRFYVASQRFNPDFQTNPARGWSHNHMLKLVINSDVTPKTAELRLPTGGLLRLEEQSAGHFEALAGSSSVLDLDDVNYALTTEDESKFVFEPTSGSTYRIQKRIWPNGEAWNYTYLDGRLDTVDDGHGRELRFAYEETYGMLAEVSDHTGRKFHYDNWELTEVIDEQDPDNPREWSYEYIATLGGEPFDSFLARRISPAISGYALPEEQYHVVLEDLTSIDTEAESIEVNGGMEDAGGWESIPGSEPILNERVASPDPVNSGTYSRKVVTDTVGQGIQSTIGFDLIKGYVYTLDASIYQLTGEVGYVQAQLLDGSGTILAAVTSYRSGEDPIPGRWREFIFPICYAPFEDIVDARIRFVSVDDGLTFYVDGVILYKYRITSIEHSRGGERITWGSLVNPVPGLLTSTFEFLPGGLNITRETVACARTTHHFANGAYVGAANPLGALAPRIMKESYRPEAWADPLGHLTELTWYTGDKLLETITDPRSQETGFTYDNDRFQDSTDAENRLTEYVYGNANVPHLPTEVKVFNDETPRKLVQWRGFEYQELFTGSGKYRVVTEEDYNPLQTTPTAVRRVKRSYYKPEDNNPNGLGLLKTVTVQDLDDTDELVTTYLYDSVGRVIEVNRVAAFGSCQKSRTVYDAAGRVVAEICNYDPPIPSSPPQDAEEAAALYDQNQPDKNRVTTYTYDEMGRRVLATSLPESSTTLTAYDALNRVRRTIQHYVPDVSVTQPYIEDRSFFDRDGKNLITDFVYNERGLLRKQAAHDDTVTLYGYDDAGRLIKTVANASLTDYDNTYGDIGDPELRYYRPGSDTSKDQVSLTFYDAAGNVIETVDPSGSRTLYVYDENGKVVKTIVNAKPEATVRVDPSSPDYVVADDPRSASYQASPQAGADLTTTQSYDGVGNLVKSVNPAGSVTMSVYDAVNRVTRTLRNPKDTATLDLKPGDPGYNAADDPRSASYEPSAAPDRDLIAETVYDGAARVQKTRSVAGTWSLSGYDGLGRAVKTIQAASDHNYAMSADPDLSGYTPSGQPDQDFVSLTVYNDDGQVRYTTDPLGRKTWMVYDTLGRVVKTIQNCTYVSGSPTPEEDTYVGSGQPDQDIITRTVYDAAGRVSATIDTRGNQTRTEYDMLGRQVRTIVNFSDGAYDPDQPDLDLISTAAYDQKGRVASTTDPAGVETRYEYDSAGRRIRTIANYVDGLFDPARPDEDVISLTEYDRAGRVVASVDARGTRTAFGYDGAGRRTSVTQAAGTPLASTSYSCYDPAGRILRSIQNWVDTGVSPDAHLAGGAWAFDPQTHGRFEDQNLVTAYTLDLLGRVTALVDPVGSLTQTAYDKDGLVTAVTDPLEFVTQQRYDAARRLTTVVQAHADNGEDPASWVWDEVDEQYEESDGTPISHGAADDRNVIVMMTYDQANRLTTRRDPRGSLTAYAYDGLDRRTGLTDPLSSNWATVYAERPAGDGQRVTLTDPNNFATQRDFDRLGRLTGVQYLGESPKLTPDVSFAYDRAGNRTRMSETIGEGTLRETRFDYDRLGRLAGVGFDTDGDGAVEQTVRYGYDAGGLRTRLTLPDGLSVSYTYNQRGELVGLSDWANQGTDFAYDGAGRMIAAERSSGLRSRYKYDAGGRLRKLRHSKGEKVLGHFAYDVDARGNRVEALECVPHVGTGQTLIAAGDTIVDTFRGGWSTAGGFTSSTDPTAALRVAFFGTRATLIVGTGPDGGIFDIRVNDKLWRSIDGYAPVSGERQVVILLDGEGPHTLEIANTGEKREASAGRKIAFKSLASNRAVDLHTIAYGYDALSRLSSADVFPGVNLAAAVRDRRYGYTYDPAGNRLSKSLAVSGGVAEVTNYSYNAANQLTGDGLNTFGYDGNGNLTSKNGQTTHTYDRANRVLSFDGSGYAYNGDGQRIGQMVGSEVTSYLLDVQPGLYKVLASTVGADTTRYIHGPMGMQSQQSPQGAWVFPVTDGLGSVRGVVSDGLSPLESRQYEPYGEPFGATGAEQTPFGFTGEWTDDNDLLYLRARYLDAGMGRFFQMDPLEGDNEFSQTINPYAYALGNPIIYNDPSGQQTIPFASEYQQLLTAFAALVAGIEALGAGIATLGVGLSLGPLLLAIGGGILLGAAIYFGVRLLFDEEFRRLWIALVHALDVRIQIEFRMVVSQLEFVVPPPQEPRFDFDDFLLAIGKFLFGFGVIRAFLESLGKHKRCDPNAVRQWMRGLTTRTIDIDADWHRYQVQVCGSPEYEVVGGGQRVWADGIDVDRCLLLDAKHATHPERDNPWYKDGALYNGFVLQVKRYAAVINDPSTPVIGLEIRTNAPRAVSDLTTGLGQGGLRIGTSGFVAEPIAYVGQ